MKAQNFNITRYDADEGKVFDWSVPRFEDNENEQGEVEKVQVHLYAKTLFIGGTDNIENYIEVDAPKE